MLDGVLHDGLKGQLGQLAVENTIVFRVDDGFECQSVTQPEPHDVHVIFDIVQFLFQRVVNGLRINAVSKQLGKRLDIIGRFRKT